MKTPTIIALLIFILAACGPIPTEQPVFPTGTSVPTLTPIPPTAIATSTPAPTNTPTLGSTDIYGDEIPDTPEAREIMETIARAYNIEAEAAYTFDLTKFPSVFINDPRFEVSPATLETIRELTNNPSLESAGYLDYKMAYYGWRRDAILHSEAVHEKAKKENRALSEEERASLRDAQGRVAPARVKSPIRKTPITFISLGINDDIAIVIIDAGVATEELTLVLVDKKWYIAASKILELNP